MSTISLNTAAAPQPGPFTTDAAYLQFVLASAISSWQQQYAGSTRDGAITAARLAANAAIDPENANGQTVPLEITPRQAELALLGAGLDGAVDAAIAAMPAGPQKRAAEITWRRSTTVQRYHPLITALGPQLGLTSAQIDALFVAAKAL